MASRAEKLLEQAADLKAQREHREKIAQELREAQRRQEEEAASRRYLEEVKKKNAKIRELFKGTGLIELLEELARQVGAELKYQGVYGKGGRITLEKVEGDKHTIYANVMIPGKVRYSDELYWEDTFWGRRCKEGIYVSMSGHGDYKLVGVHGTLEELMADLLLNPRVYIEDNTSAWEGADSCFARFD